MLKYLMALPLLALLALSAVSQPAETGWSVRALDARAVAAGPGASIFRIETRGITTDKGRPCAFIGQGTGVYTDRGLLTAWHVVRGVTSVEVTDYLGVKHSAAGWWRQSGEDVALIRLRDGPLKNIPRLRDAQRPLQGTRAYGVVYGYWGEGVDLALLSKAEGTVVIDRNYDAAHLGAHFYCAAIPAVAGMSGSPMIVEDRVYGILSHTTQPPSFTYFAWADQQTCPVYVGQGVARTAPPSPPVPKPAPPVRKPAPVPCPPGGT